jgi:hypothetical protein
MNLKIWMSTVLVFIVLSGVCIAAPGSLDGPYALNGVLSDSADWWASEVVDSQNHSSVENILGATDSGLAVGSTGGGFITVGFDVSITNGTGYDFAVWENGFSTTYIPSGSANGHSGIYAELAFVDVSTDGTNWVTFPSAYLDDMTPYPNVDPTYVNNLAGNFVAYYADVETYEGTPFDLDDILDTPEVLSGLVDPGNINYVRLRDIIGAGEGGSEYDAFGNLIYDGNGFGGGADWNSVGVINAVPIPGALWLFGCGLMGLFGIRKSGRRLL